MLVTSRRNLPELSSAHRHRLQPFSVDEGVTLLSRIIDGRRVIDERQVAEEIVDMGGGLPLAVRIMGARLQPQPTIRLSALADRLRDDHHRLDELQQQSCEFGMRGWLFWTFDTHETEDQRRLFHLTDEGGAINEVLAPAVRPDPCAG